MCVSVSLTGHMVFHLWACAFVSFSLQTAFSLSWDTWLPYISAIYIFLVQATSPDSLVFLTQLFQEKMRPAHFGSGVHPSSSQQGKVLSPVCLLGIHWLGWGGGILRGGMGLITKLTPRKVFKRGMKTNLVSFRMWPVPILWNSGNT